MGDASDIHSSSVRWSSHRRAEVKAFVEEDRGKIRLEPLPPYAPDLNPVE